LILGDIQIKQYELEQMLIFSLIEA